MNILKAVLHILDRDSVQPVLNDYELEINDDIESFVKKHVTKSLLSEEIRKAKFSAGKNIVNNSLKSIVKNDKNFLEDSKEIAKELFRAMKTHGGISSTDLLICIYEEKDEYGIGILKLDYNTSFIHFVDNINGKFKITIRKQEMSLPSPNQRLQKCAFFPFSQDEEYDILILDNQVSANSKEPIALFFLKDFLKATLVNDDKSYTMMLKKETDNFIETKKKIGEEVPTQFKEIVNNAFRIEEEIDINSLKEEIFLNNEEMGEEYLTVLRDTGFDCDNFKVDKEWVSKKLNKVKLKIDDGIEILIPFEEFSDTGRFQIFENDDGTKSITINRIWNLNEK